MNNEIEHKQALYELMCRYCNAVDRKHFNRLKPLYMETAHHDHGSMFKGSPAEFIAFLERSMQKMTTQHMIGNHLYYIEGDRAEGEIYTVNYHFFDRPEGIVEYIAGGRYIDHYRKVDNQWRISHRKRLIDWTRERPASPAATQPAGLLPTEDTVLAGLYPTKPAC